MLAGAMMLGLCAGTNAVARLDQGSVTGLVQDSSGAAVRGAALTLIDSDTGLQSQTTSNGIGIYMSLHREYWPAR